MVNMRLCCTAVKGHGRICPMGADQLVADPVGAAQRLLGATLTGRGVTAMIVEVEAYGGVPDGPWPDAAAHSYRGPTGRNTVMFGPPGRLYTYRSHGIHVCANVVCGADGVAAAVLLRAAAIETGLDVASRGAVRPSAASRWRADREISARLWESPWPTTASTCLTPTVRCG
jgi:DNA-3-methyladenine glycosylase